MGIVIGIDVGGSTTKIVGVEDKKIKNPMFVKATDPVTSLFGAFGKYIYDNNISLSNIEKVILTGVGSAYIDQPLYGLPTAKTDEFLANGLGAQYNTGLDSLLVVTSSIPCFRKGCVTVSNPAQETFLDVSGWGMGEVWINGQYLGAYWEENAEKTLEIPAGALIAGNNEIVVFELKNNEQASMTLTDKPIFK